MIQILLCLLLAIVIVYLSNMLMNKYEGMSAKRQARKAAKKDDKAAKKEAKTAKKEQKKDDKAAKKEQKKDDKAAKKEGRKEHRTEKKEAKTAKKEQKKDDKAAKKEGRKEHRTEKKDAREEHRTEKKEAKAAKKEAKAAKKEGRKEDEGKIYHASTDEENLLNEQISRDIANIDFSSGDKNNLADVVNEFRNKKIKNANKDTILKYIRSIRVLKLRINNEILFKTKFTDVFNFSDDTSADQDIVSVLTNVDSTIKKKTAVISQLNILEDSLIDHYNYLQKLVN
jgi:hypothetical protein